MDGAVRRTVDMSVDIVLRITSGLGHGGISVSAAKCELSEWSELDPWRECRLGG